MQCKSFLDIHFTTYKALTQKTSLLLRGILIQFKTVKNNNKKNHLESVLIYLNFMDTETN